MAMERITVFEDARKACAAVMATINALEAQYHQLEAHRVCLARLPMEDASPYWHEEKYLYTIGKTVNGRRPRQYIGNKPEKVEEALARISNFDDYQSSLAKMTQIRNKTKEAQFLAQRLLRVFSEGLFS